LEAIWIALIVFLVLVAVALVVGGGLFLFLRFRAGEPIRIPLRFLLRLYMHVVIIAGLLLLTQGFSGLLRAGLAGAAGKDFSYYPAYVGGFPGREPRPVEPLELKERRDLTPEELEKLSQIETERQKEELERQREAQRKGLDRALKEGLIEGVSFAIIGAIIWAVHLLGRRWLETDEERESLLNRIYLILIVVIFGIITIVNLPQAVFESFRFYLLDPLDEFNRSSPPGGKLALSIVALPIWITYLLGTIRAVRRGA